jgi:hypothetical protein
VDLELLGTAGLFWLATVVMVVALGRKVPAVWKGDADAMPSIPHQVPFAVHPRSFVTFTMVAFAFVGGFTLLVSTPLVNWEFLDEPLSLWPGGILLIASVPLALLHLVVNAFNRPKWLVPPAFRDQPGSVFERRERRQRVGQGLPPTLHRITINHRMHVKAGRPESDWWAECTEPECGWEVEAPDNTVDPGRDLRRLAAGHSSEVVLDEWSTVSNPAPGG